MVDASTIVALVVAGAALIIAAGQLAQQLLSTAYVLYKCDQIVTGGLTAGGKKKFHWQQFRFTVAYRAIIFALPAPLYSALGVRNTVQVHSLSQELWSRSMRLRPTRNTAAQSCWISFVQDLIACACIKPEDIGLKEESGDRIPVDLTTAPTQVNAITVMLTCVAMGMQVFKYTPTSGEISIAGGLGSISSSTHPILGGLLHYSVFTDEPSIGFEATRRNGRALLQEKGVWANAVFGRFKDRSYRPEFTNLEILRRLKLGVLMASRWPQDSYTDTIHGAACFLAFSHTDIYEVIPPSCVRPWCAHFAEVIVKSHLMQLVKEESGTQANLGLSSTFYQMRQAFIDTHGCSSPYLPWEQVSVGAIADTEKRTFDLQLDNLPLHKPESANVLACPGLISCAVESETASDPTILEDIYKRDPSSYVPTDAAWEAILLADQRLHLIYKAHGRWPDQDFGRCSEQIVACAIRSLAEVGAPSWREAAKAIKEWPATFAAACDEVLNEWTAPVDRRWVSVHAHLSLLRAAYFTVMMRGAGDVGPGISEQEAPGTALVYMA